MAFRTSILLILCALQLNAEPWGKDASMVKPSPSTRKERAGHSEVLLRGYQRYISPVSGPRSHFYPTSSEYMRRSIAKYGFFEGLPRGCDRLLRENGERWIYPLVYKYDAWRKYDPA